VRAVVAPRPRSEEPETEMPSWLTYALVTTLFWGVWGALIELPEKRGFPATLGYVVWALTMVPCALVALAIVGWKLETDLRSIALGAAAGLLGAGGQLALFETLRRGPAYLVFPIVGLSPAISVVLAVALLGESTTPRVWTGIVLALIAVPLLSYQPPGKTPAASGKLWLWLSLAVCLAWGIQAYVLRFANQTMSSEGIFFYMTATGVLLIPVALWMTDFQKPINWRPSGLAAAIQSLNSIGALTMVYAFRYGQAIVVSPLINAVAPAITVLLSLILYRTIPHRVVALGMVLAAVAFYLMS
jgi:drug/metabolite transporter (DMT)-like permease